MTLNLSLLELLVIGLAVWRTSYMLVREAGPFQIFTRLRARTTMGGILNCTHCMSIWMAALMLALWHTPLQAVVWIAAVSGAALMLASWTGVNHPQ